MRDTASPRPSLRPRYPSAIVVLIVAFGFVAATSPLAFDAAARSPVGAQKRSPSKRAHASSPLDIEMVRIPAGSFKMGSMEEEDEQPIRTVQISKPFYLGKYEITQAQWTAVMGRNPSRTIQGDLPVERVTWVEAHQFVERLRAKTGKPYRLPTEAEWEYACRAGSNDAYSFGNDNTRLAEYAWFVSNSDEELHPVGKLKPNAWGLYDMHGNVWEWCDDWYGEDYYAKAPSADPKGPPTGRDRVIRGGSYGSEAWGCRSSNRFPSIPDDRLVSTGLRVALSK